MPEPGGFFRSLRALPRDRRGTVAMAFAAGLPVLGAAAGAAVDFANMSARRGELQSIADAAALAAAREFRLGNTSEQTVQQAARNFALSQLQQRGLSASVDPLANSQARTVAVTLASTVPVLIMQIAGASASTVKATATARMVGGSPLCVVGLDQSANQTVSAQVNARLEATGCTIYSNSLKPGGLMAKDFAVVKAGFICSAGGKSGAGPGSFSPLPQIDCPPLPDPLSARPLPSAGICLGRKLDIKAGNQILSPGTYCDGVTISGTAKVTLDPGVYIFKDGPLTVTGGGSLTGANVTLHFSGTGAAAKFTALSSISLTAPRGGESAGLLLTEDRAGSDKLRHEIMSDDARMLLGTIYLPRSELYIGANKPVADRSAYTIVVARIFTLSEGPTMVMNTNYSGTDIPVPNGVGPSGGASTLVN